MQELNINELIQHIEIPSINPSTNYWLVRTKQGHFYNEFIREQYIALGWNIIDKKVLTNISKEKKKTLLKEVGEKYRVKTPTGPFNKCIKFIDCISPGDLLMIPSASSEFITFAVAGEYYEESDLNFAKEFDVISQIDAGFNKILDIKCPYKKRRKISVIKTIPGNRLNPNLYRALISYHGLSSIDDYAYYMLSTIYNVFYYNNEVTYVFNVEKTKDINPIAVSRLIIDYVEIAGEILQDKTDISKLTGKMNINSPGDIMLTVQNISSDIVEFLTSNKLLFLCIWIALCGGEIEFAGFKFKSASLLEHIYKFREQNSKLKDDKLRRELVQQYIKKLSESSKELEVNADNFNNIINIEDFIKDKKNKKD